MSRHHTVSPIIRYLLFGRLGRFADVKISTSISRAHDVVSVEMCGDLFIGCRVKEKSFFYYHLTNYLFTA
ncbi:hypothetical protein Btru_061684 [Bulinus truncatus]|nr:hypothetical protein Btru_061684 [Bulinus truncatus]